MTGLAFVEFALLAISLALLVTGLVKAEEERKAVIPSFPGPGANLAPVLSLPVSDSPLPIPPPVLRTERVEVADAPTNPLDNPPLLRLLEDLSRFGGDLAADAEHFSATDRELSNFVGERVMEMIERVPGVTAIVPAPGSPAIRGEHRGMDGSFREGTVQRVVVPGVRVAERILRPAQVEFEERESPRSL